VVRHTYVPRRWAPSYHRYHVSHPHWHPGYWGAGVFIYSPPPTSHHVVVVDGSSSGGGAVIEEAEAPTRAVDRNGDLGIGITAGTYGSGYDMGGEYGDMGLGLQLEWRPVESVGLELAYQHHSETWDDTAQRLNNPMQASVQLYAFPWTRVSPYLSAGLTLNERSVSDTFYDGLNYQHVETSETLFGPHAGLGVEFALGENMAVDFEGKYIGYLDVADEDPSLPGAVQGTMGLSVYF